ncbi:unknown [Bacteroides sp. CAG:545]|nr:unknown [Bacteroides sp. CAG:545]
MLSLSVKRRDFADKLFKINNLSGRRRGFTDEIHSVRQRLTGIAVELTK